MKNKLIIIILLLALTIVLIFTIKNHKGREEPITEKDTTVSEVEGLIVPNTYETKVLNPNSAYLKFDVKYPYFKNADKDFNSKIETLIKGQIQDDIKTSQENWQARYDTQSPGENIPRVPQNDADKFYFSSDFTIVQSNSSYISFVLDYSGFNGGAHGYENKVSYNYDVKNQKNIELKDLFLNYPDYLTYLSTTSKDYLMNQFAIVSDEDKKNSIPEVLKEYIDNIVSMINSGIEPKEENFSIFTFTPNKIKIYFAQYQVGPYVFGMPEVEMDRKNTATL
jgi:hypothetical protein